MILNIKRSWERKDLSLILCMTFLIYIAMCFFSKQQILTIFLTLMGTLAMFLLIFFKTFRKEPTNATIFFLIGSIGLINTVICIISLMVAIPSSIMIKIVIGLVLCVITFLILAYIKYTIKKEKKGVSSNVNTGIITFITTFVVVATHYFKIYNLKFEILTIVAFLLFSLFSGFLVKFKDERDKMG